MKRVLLIIIYMSQTDRMFINNHGVVTLQVSDESERKLRVSRFSGLGDFIVAASSRQLHVWRANEKHGKVGSFVASVAIHSTDGFPMTIDPFSNCVATASTLATAIKVWDLDRIFKCAGAQMQVRMPPLFCKALL